MTGSINGEFYWRDHRMIFRLPPVSGKGKNRIYPTLTIDTGAMDVRIGMKIYEVTALRDLLTGYVDAWGDPEVEP